MLSELFQDLKHSIILVNKLPFLKENSWPKRAKVSGESRYGYSEDEELMEDAAKELMQAFVAKDFKAILEAIEALVRIIKNKYEDIDVEALEKA